MYALEFFTATILQWKHLLTNDKYKEIIIASLRFLTKEKRVNICAYVIMNNHLHLIWQPIPPHSYESIRRDFLKYTAQMTIKDLRRTNKNLLEEFRVDTSDRKYQVWERNALSIHLKNEGVLFQKINYIHENPVRAGICDSPVEYKYSSAQYYDTGIDEYDFLTHYRY